MTECVWIIGDFLFSSRTGWGVMVCVGLMMALEFQTEPEQSQQIQTA